MDLLAATRRALEVARYLTRSSPSRDTFIFEDESLFGFVWIAPAVPSILENWQAKQGTFLSDRDEQLRKSKGKSWNIYSVFLTEADPSPAEENELVLIEEDFRGTRKLARAGLHTSSQIARVLLPLIPLQNLVVLGEEDAMNRMKTRLTSLPEPLLDAILGSATATQVADLIRRSDED